MNLDLKFVKNSDFKYMFVNYADLTSIQLSCIIIHIKQLNLYNLNNICGVYTNTWQMSLGIALLQTFNCIWLCVTESALRIVGFIFLGIIGILVAY